MTADVGAGADLRAVVLVEGMSDRYALEVLAQRRGRDLAAEGVQVVAMKGATNIGHYLDRYGPRGLDVKVAGLYDAAEEGCYQRGLERAGFGPGLTQADMEALGFFRCAADLEDELIRAVGTDAVEWIIESKGELRSFRILQRQPAQRGRSTHDQLRRFMGSKAGRKHRYARLLADAVDLARVPRSLDELLAYV